jgi:hypothetical protein
MVTAQIIMGYTPHYKSAGSPLKYLNEQILLEEQAKNSVLNRLGNAIGGIFGGGTAEEQELAKYKREKDGRSWAQRWWDGVVIWVESFFESASKKSAAAAWDAETGAGHNTEATRGPALAAAPAPHTPAKPRGVRNLAADLAAAEEALEVDVSPSVDVEDDLQSV